MPSRDKIAPEEIQAERKALGMTQTALADALGIPVRTLRQWEQGQQGCGNPALLRFAFACLKKHGRASSSGYVARRRS